MTSDCNDRAGGLSNLFFIANHETRLRTTHLLVGSRHPDVVPGDALATTVSN